MEVKSTFSKDQSGHQQDPGYFPRCDDVDSYDDNHVSDIESRLYAEIYYSNSHVCENESIDKSTAKSNVVTDSSSAALPDQQSVSVNCNDNSYGSNPSNGDGRSISNTSRLQVNSDNDSRQIIQNTNESARTLEIDNSSSRRKRKKKENDNSSVIVQSQDVEAQNKSNNQVINPVYNKQAADNAQGGIKLLSQEFFNLFWSKKPKNPRKPPSKTSMKKCASKKILRKNNMKPSQSKFLNRGKALKEMKSNQADQVNFFNRQKTTDSTATNEQVKSPQNKNMTVNNVSSLTDDTAVIDLGSESSEDSVDEKSKYATIESKEKKLKKSFTLNDDDNDSDSSNDDSTSDSEESIFEVPVPPKPKPVLIDLKDSDSDNNHGNDKDDSDSSTDESSTSEMDTTQEESENFQRTTSNSDDPKTNEENSLILNCTEIQKSAHSLHEIRSISCNKSSTKDLSDDGRTEQIIELDNEVEICDNEVQDKSSNNTDSFEIIDQNKQNGLHDTATSSIDRQSGTKAGSNKKKVLPKNDFFQPMSKKMREFYDKSWGGEDFDMEKLKNTMSSDPRKWAILDDDIALLARRNKRYFTVLCSRCNKNGHKTHQCPEKFKGPICHMCGVTGHFQTSCPHKKCLTCGKTQRMYSPTCDNCVKMQCSRCHSRGHLENSCPDLWRRYHHTINTSNIQVSQDPRQMMKPQNELFCCNCARKGHDFNSCRKLKWTQHFSTPSHVVNYAGPAYSFESPPETSLLNNERRQETLHNLNSSSNNSVNFSNTCSDQHVVSSLKTNTDNIPRHQGFSKENGNKIIFEVKSGNVAQVQRRTKFNLSIPYGNNVDSIDNWRPLIRFLNEVVSNIPACFSLEQKDNRTLCFHINCSRNYITSLTKLIKQYADRSDLERTRVFLEWERDPCKIASRISSKIMEMSALNQDPLELYEEYTNLDSKTVNLTYNGYPRQEFLRLLLLQEKLLVSLYKEGFADDSLKDLKKLVTKMQKVESYLGKIFKKKQKYSGIKEIKFKLLFDYLYLYNSIFTPHKPKNLTTFIANYKEYMRKRDNFINNSSFTFSSQEQGIVRSQPQVGNAIPLMSVQVSPPPPVHLENASSPRPVLPYCANPQGANLAGGSGSQKINRKNKIVNNEEKQKGHVPKYLKNLLATATRLNAPHLQSHIDNLKSKIKNEKEIDRKDLQQLQKMVRREKRNREKVT